MKLAIVGSGISGMACAHYLKEKYKISIFEKNDYLGGHTHTHRLKHNKSFTLDTGFIVFNEKTYPNLIRFFKELGVEKQKSDMSFSVYNMDTGLQYSSKRLFAQRKNLLSPRYWLFLRQINRFFRVAQKKKGKSQTIRNYCREHGLSDFFIDNYLVPMSSAVWSMPHEEVYEFPISLLIPFFKNHGLLGINQQLQWYTVKGGSDTYIHKIVNGSDLDIHLNEPVTSVEQGSKVRLTTRKRTYNFDRVILASHADESLTITNLPDKKRKLLEAFPYTPNKAILHTDASIMPPLKDAWASWNHVISKNNTSTIYWLNRLQKPDTKTNYFLSLNPFQKIPKRHIVKEMNYHHPSFSVENFALQKRLQEINKDTNIFFTGSYFRYGFHEDGISSALKVVEQLQ
ncbi:MAG: FAD-dependent oxidoreductase [Candidatus Woesearchaeota archaeon]